jgi:16S rRNA (cytosine967-C5)-methyltransferase
MGVYQLRFLDRIPPSAAVNESVNLVKESRCSSAKGLVNAVLRRAASNLNDRPGEDVEDELERLSIEVSHPRWMLERWKKQFEDEARVRSLALANNEPARLSFRVNRLRAPEATTISDLEARGVKIRKSAVSSSGFVVEGGPASAVIEAADNGLVYIQDEASQLAGEMVDPQAGDLIMDLSAAPGSKATHMAELSLGRARIICCDLHWRRLRVLEATCRRLNVTSTYAVACDGAQPLPLTPGLLFDRVLVDAPCSGTGTLRQNPEIKWRLGPGDLVRLANVQLALVGNAASVLKPGGILVYSTCSIEPEENEDVIAVALQKIPGLEKVLPARSTFITADGFVRLYPDTHGTEGFFITVLRKVS